MSFLLRNLENLASDEMKSLQETTMSKKQLEDFFAKAQSNTKLQEQIHECGENNSCVVAVGEKYGHKFSPATVSHWQRDH